MSRITIALHVNGEPRRVTALPGERLSSVLREQLGLMGTKIGCEAGDCGACTVLIDGRQACACLAPLAQLEGADVRTVEGLCDSEIGRRLQRSFLLHGAAQCGICTPGMLMAAAELLMRHPRPDRRQVEEALGGVLCRCTGYRKIVSAVVAAGGEEPLVEPPRGGVGAPTPRLDGPAKIAGTARFGADEWPSDCLELRLVRSPHMRARFELGDLEGFRKARPGLHAVLTAADIPGRNGYGIYPDLKDQPVLAEGEIRHRGEPVLALVGEPETVRSLRDEELPIRWHPLPPLRDFEAALREDAPVLHEGFPDNVLIRGRVARGDVERALEKGAARSRIDFETSFVEHAYIEPEAGWARRIGDRIEVFATTQAPYMDRAEVAAVLGIAPERVRILPSVCGGGFGGKLDVSVQPILAVAAWLLDRPVRTQWSRPESMAASTKRHPARIRAEASCDASGRLLGFRFHGDFDTGAYASWGPTVAQRVPVHAVGPYRVEAVRATTRAIFTNGPPSGAFRGFGVPQAAIAHEALMDMLADGIGMDRLEFRLANALRSGDITCCGQRLGEGVGLVACLERLRPLWREQRRRLAEDPASDGPLRRGLGIACMWYGLGNTSMSNPSGMEVALSRDGRVILYNGAVDIGQGSATIMVQICADALGLPVDCFEQVLGDTDRTLDAGKTSASRQTFVSGNAARLAGLDLRRRILRLANAGPDARLELDGSVLRVRDGEHLREIELARLEVDEEGNVLRGSGRWDPPTRPLDADGQGEPYAAYGFAAQMALVEVDRELGLVRPLRIWAAHDVGRAVNPRLVEGQIEGGIAQGIGLALLEEFLPGVNENLHDYLIPTVGDVPEIEIFLIEEGDPLGPFGAKGVGEPALIPTAPAILNAVADATGVRPRKVPLTPSRLLELLAEKGG